MFKRFSVGFATGYVFGARAGQKRYDQITDLADRVMKMPGVDRLAAQASEMLTADHGRELYHRVVDRARAAQSGDEAESEPADEGYDEDDAEPEDEGYAEAADEGYDDAADEDDDAGDDLDDAGGDDRDSAGDEVEAEDRNQPDAEDDAGPRGGRIRSLASAARERGRVD